MVVLTFLTGLIAFLATTSFAAPAPAPNRYPPPPGGTGGCRPKTKTTTFVTTLAPPTTPTTYPPAYPTTSACTISICVDNVNECGMMFGGCYLIPECGGTVPIFTPPPCPSTDYPTYPTSDDTYPTPSTYTTTPMYPNTTSSSYPTSTTCDYQICADYVDACGQWYGGCYLAPECGGVEPTFTPPYCSISSTTYPEPTIYTTTTSTSDYPTTTDDGGYPTTSACDYQICADYVDACGQWYGGCYLAPECGGVEPTFTPPYCSISSTKPCTPTIYTTTPDYPTTTTPTTATTDDGSYPTTTTVTTDDGSYPTSSTCDYHICVDYVDACGQWYGGCYLAPECGGGPEPTFTTPYCSIVTPTLPPPTSTDDGSYPTGDATTTTSTTSTDDGTYPTSTPCDTHLCVDYIDACGQWYGGCYLIPECGGAEPTFATPYCSLSPSSTYEPTTYTEVTDVVTPTLPPVDSTTEIYPTETWVTYYKKY